MSDGAICPACGRPVYDNRRTACGYCGGALPETLRRSPESEACQAAVKARLELQRAEDRAQAEAEAEAEAARWTENPIPNAGMDWMNRP